jgi:hypothetical protein
MKWWKKKDKWHREVSSSIDKFWHREVSSSRVRELKRHVRKENPWWWCIEVLPPTTPHDYTHPTASKRFAKEIQRREELEKIKDLLLYGVSPAPEASPSFSDSISPTSSPSPSSSASVSPSPSCDEDLFLLKKKLDK